MDKNIKDIKKAKAVIRLIMSKDLLNNNTDYKDDKYLKEKIENLFKYIRLDIIESASSYKHNEDEDFTEDIINSIFSDKEVFCQQAANLITYKDLLDICGEEYKEEYFIKPINAYKDAADQIEYLYHEAFDALGLDGIKAVNLSIPRIIENDNFNTKELTKVSENTYEEADLINRMISNVHGIDYELGTQNFCEKLFSYFKHKQEDEERNRKYTYKKI